MDWTHLATDHGQRLDRLDEDVRDLCARLALVERGATGPEARGWRPPAPPPPPPQPARRPEPAAPSRPPAAKRLDLEDLLGGRVLGTAGGIAVLLGIGFLVAMAVNRGWLDEQARILLGFAGSAALLAGGLWLHERRGRTQAARAAVAAAIAGLYATLTAATRLYDLLGLPVSLCIAVVIGAVATAIAVRWRSTTVAALGIVGALLAPLLVGAPVAGATVAFTLIALAAATTVVVWQRWGGLALAAFVVALLQIGAWLDAGPPAVAIVLVLAATWALGTLAALGVAARAEARPAPLPSFALLAGTAAFAAAAGYLSLRAPGGQTAASLWVAAIAVAQLGAGVFARRSRLVDRDLAALALATSLAAADAAFALLADGPVLTVGFAASALALAALTRGLRVGGDRLDRAQVTLSRATQLALAAGHALFVDARPAELVTPSDPRAASALALAVLAAGFIGSARIGERDEAPAHAAVLDALGLAAIAYLTTYVLDGTAVALAWALEAAAVAALGRLGRVPYAAVGSVCLLVLAATHALAFEALPRALVYGVEDLGAAALALTAVAANAAAAARLAPPAARALRLGLFAVAALALVYLGSVAIVTAFQPAGEVLLAAPAHLSVRQQGQFLLSAFWSVAGVAALVVGLRRREPYVRWGGFGLLGAATAKVFLFDLSALESLYRVGSFVALGLLLLGGAFAYQRLRGPDGAPTGAG